MSENPKPPPGYPTWLDFAAETMSSDYFILDVLPGTRTLTAINLAKRELNELRSERDRLRELLTEALPWAAQYEIAPMWSARVRKELAK